MKSRPSAGTKLQGRPGKGVLGISLRERGHREGASLKQVCKVGGQPESRVKLSSPSKDPPGWGGTQKGFLPYFLIRPPLLLKEQQAEVKRTRMSFPLVSSWQFSQLCQGCAGAGDPHPTECKPRSHAAARDQQVSLDVII